MKSLPLAKDSHAYWVSTALAKDPVQQEPQCPLKPQPCYKSPQKADLVPRLF